MKYFVSIILSVLLTTSCNQSLSILPRSVVVRDTVTIRDTIIVRDTIAHQNGLYIFNLPCKLEYINFENPDKAILVFWFHGGVRDLKAHNLLNPNNNHIDKYRNHAYNAISAYLHKKGKKAVYIAPLCHKAEMTRCVSWIECEAEIRRIIDDYVKKDIVDSKRIYVAGCSDGGVGVWDYVSKHEDWFAAGMSFSSNAIKMTKIPMYCSSTSSNSWGDLSSQINQLNRNGANIRYVFCPNTPHGWDEDKVVNEEYLDSFFSHIR